MTTTQEQIRYLSSIAENEALDYAIYTVENRAIPNLVDGFKPVQRFVMYEALKKANSGSFVKLASVASGVSDAGYHHGEDSAQEAGKLMANTWSNNIPLLEGQGNFGSRLVQEGAAARYIFCRVHDNFNLLYKDSNIAPKHEDPEHKPPKFYLPVIPTVLLNGVRGIATGYSTNIHPYSIESILDTMDDIINDKKTVRPPVVKMPAFNGEIEQIDESSINILGTYKKGRLKNEIIITEIPIKFDREKYIEVLDKLEESNEISYTDHCGKDGFEFKVKLKAAFGIEKNEDKMHSRIMSKFKLVQPSTEYIVVIDENGKLKDRNDFPNATSLIRHFINVRSSFLEERIKYMIGESTNKFNLATAKYQFIEKIIDGSLVLQGLTRKQALSEIQKHQELKPYAETLIGMSIYHITKDEVKKLKDSALKAKQDLEYWESTTPQEQYKSDLKTLRQELTNN